MHVMSTENLKNELVSGIAMEDQKPLLQFERPDLNSRDVGTNFHKFILRADETPLEIGQDIPNESMIPILIATTFRTGSSYLGDLLYHYPGSIYRFEPLEFVKKGKTIEIIRDLFTCQAEQSFPRNKTIIARAMCRVNWAIRWINLCQRHAGPIVATYHHYCYTTGL